MLIKSFYLKEKDSDFGEIYNAILVVNIDKEFFGIPFGYAFHNLNIQIHLLKKLKRKEIW
ncbi:MAG: hypothetical protein H0Z24_09360 [Thermosipho sp. (in: Bacteria)]|nr:hypothetical protein [Thermosipho sp. (in: thermotogales)]